MILIKFCSRLASCASHGSGFSRHRDMGKGLRKGAYYVGLVGLVQFPRVCLLSQHPMSMLSRVHLILILA